MKIYKIILALFVVMLSGCGVYSLTGGSTDAKSVSVATFQNAAGGPPNLSQKLSEDLRSYYLQNTRLEVLNEGGELIIEGEIVGYYTSPLAPTANDLASKTRLTITVQVRFTNNLHPEKDFEQNFTQYADFDQSLSLSQVESQKVEEILEKIIFDIFQKTVVDW